MKPARVAQLTIADVGSNDSSQTPTIKTPKATVSATAASRRRLSQAAAAHRRKEGDGGPARRARATAAFWDVACNELAVGQLSIYDFDPSTVRHLTGDASQALGGLGNHNAQPHITQEMLNSPTTPQIFADAIVSQPTGQPKQCRIDGEVWPPIFTAANVRSAKAFVPEAGDVFVCTYPKCGTTWLQHICSQLMSPCYEPNTGKVAELCMTSPMIEKMGAEYLDTLRRPRLLKTHMSYNNCPKSAKAKYIFTVRNVKDCLTSYYFHNRNFKIYEWARGDFDVFFELFVNGELAFGDYFDHLLSWLPHINDKNVLFLTYEDMYSDLEEAIREIGQFLGGRSADIVNDAGLLERVVAESRIDAMKQNQDRFFPGKHLRGNFIRRGGSRDWKNYMNREQSDRLTRIYRSRMANTVAETWWEYELAWNDEVEIILNTEDGEKEVTEADDFRSDSRSSSRSSVYTPTPFMPQRRNSVLSVASSGWGSRNDLSLLQSSDSSL